MLKMETLAAMIATILLPQGNTSDPNAWEYLIKQDLTQVYESVRSNHPGYVDTENPNFQDWLVKGYEQGMASAKDAHSPGDAMTILSTYFAGFADTHFHITFNYQPKHQKWAGLVIKKQAAYFRVHYADESWPTLLPPVSSILLSCDGRPADIIMREDVLQYTFSNSHLNFIKVWNAPKLFIDDGIGKRHELQSCVFRVNGANEVFKMTWEDISTKALFLKTQTPSRTGQFAIDEITPKHIWVTLPNFSPDEQEQAALRSIIMGIEAARDATLIVFDVRGNDGGNSQWGFDLLNALHGKAYVDTINKRQSDTEYAMWRASPENHNHLNKLLPDLDRQFGKASGIYKEVSDLSSRMKMAISTKLSLIRQDIEPKKKNINPSHEAHPLTQAKIVLLTDSHCASACLDFADLLLALPGVIHAGQETAADSQYTDVRFIDLPSGLGSYSLPQKVIRGRPRRPDQSYIPEFEYEGDISNTEKLKAWILDLEHAKKL